MLLGNFFVTGTIDDNSVFNDVWSSGLISLSDIILLYPGETYTANLNISPDVSLDDGSLNGNESIKLFVQGAASPLGGFDNNGVNYSLQFTDVGGEPLLVNPVTGTVSWNPIGGSVNVSQDIDLINGGKVDIGGIQLTLTNVHPTNVWAFSGLSVGLDADDAAFTSPWWPVRNANGTPNHQMLQGFGDGQGYTYNFHQGIDILASGNGGEVVVAARPGKLIKKGTDSGGFVTIEVDIGGGKFEYDRYFHVDPRTTKANGDPIAGGEMIGKISTTAFSAGSCHLHYEVLNQKIENGLAAPEKAHLNPFLRFTDKADRDPLGQKPQLQETNKDDPEMTLSVTESGQTKPIPKQTIKGDVDLIADVRDPMHDTLLMASAPHKVGYWVKGLFDQGVVAHGVKTAAHPYILSKFDDNWFPDQPFTKGKFPLVYDDSDSRKVAPNPTDFKLFYRNFIVTNTQGEDGRVNNVVDQYWNTNAEDDGQADTVAYANYSKKDNTPLPDTTLNAKARFKDGEYEVHIIMQDLVNPQVDAPAGKLRLDNFTQTAGAMKGGGKPAPKSPVQPLYGNNTTPYVPDFMPEVSIAKIDTNFFLGDPVGIFGDQYYPDLLMPAYIFPHKTAGWNEYDPFTGYIQQIFVQSDGNGTVPLTEAWTADKSGLYDVIIDYDRDGLFTWTMDGLDGFKVLEKLGEVELRAGVQGKGDYEVAIGPNGAHADLTGQMEIDWTKGPLSWNLGWDKNLGKATFSAAGQTISFTNADNINKDFNVFKLVASAKVNGNVPAGSSVNLTINTINGSSVDYSVGAVAPGFQESVSNIFSPAITSMAGTAAISGGTLKGRSSLDLKLKLYDPPVTNSDPLTGQNTIAGTSENDMITGTSSDDLITGGQGRDRFVFRAPNQGADTITDFTVAEDTLAVSAAGFGGGLTQGLLSESQFTLGATATTENHRFIYNSSDGILGFDQDGTGAIAPKTIAALSPNLNLSYQQFVIIA